ncbi:MAG: outer membrane protein assembly factor BamE [Gammaproteobacteria bacterium]|nr:MAG: outer membrane protein assembly factor BamE [Gammaproteobacteria bacterium]
MQKLLIYLTFCVALGGCTAYAPPVEQGNLLDAEAVARLHPGMSAAQVRFLLGPPLLRDPFHRDRWDYVYWEARRGRPPVRKHLVLRFREGRLASVERVGL